MVELNTKRGVWAEFWEGFLSIFRGMAVTFRNLVGREKITVQFPYERAPISPRFRGLFYLPYDEEAGRLKCVGCTLCEQACPTQVITMNKLGAGKHAGVDEFDMDLGRCMFCNLCIEACPFDAIHMGPEYVLASENRNASMFNIEMLTPGGRPNVERNNATVRALLAEEEAKKAAAGHTGHSAPAEPAE